MGFSIQYRSIQTMHPARAFEVKEQAQQLNSHFTWISCQPVLLSQQSGGHLAGCSKPNLFPADLEARLAETQGLPDGTVMTLVEVLCALSRDHEVDWQLGHDYEADPIGEIRGGVADPDLLSQLEAFNTIGELLDEMVSEEGAFDIENSPPIDPLSKLPGTSGKKLASKKRQERDEDDGEPRVIKFPGLD